MKKLFLSDIHLGCPFFKHKDFLISLLSDSSYDSIYFIGDIFDIWEMPIDNIFIEYQEIIEALKYRSKDIIFIKGNHDPEKLIIKSFLPTINIYDFSILIVNNLKYLIFHGHEYDDIIVNYSWVAKFLFRFQWVLERVGINIKAWLRNLYYSVASKRGKYYYNDLVLGIEQEIVRDKIEKYDGVIVGHTHFPKIWNNGLFNYINCGDWIHNYTYVELIDNEFHLRYIN